MTDLITLLQQGAGNAGLFIPSAILVGALHGLEPGHSKTITITRKPDASTRAVVWYGSQYSGTVPRHAFGFFTKTREATAAATLSVLQP